MNKWEEVAKLLDLELEEEFRFSHDGHESVCKYKFTSDGFLYKSENNDVWLVDNYDTVLSRIIGGRYEVVQRPWKPKEDEAYYCAGLNIIDNENNERYTTVRLIWRGVSADYLKWNIGNCFKTEKEAREKGIPLMKKIVEEFENE